MMNSPHIRHHFELLRIFANRYIVGFGILAIKLSQSSFMRMMNCAYKRRFDETRIRQAECVIEMDNIASIRCVSYCPSSVSDFFQSLIYTTHRRPHRLRVIPTELCLHLRLSVCVYNHFMPHLAEAFRKVSDKKFRASIANGRDGNEWRCNECNSHE